MSACSHAVWKDKDVKPVSSFPMMGRRGGLRVWRRSAGDDEDNKGSGVL